MHRPGTRSLLGAFRSFPPAVTYAARRIKGTSYSASLARSQYSQSRGQQAQRTRETSEAEPTVELDRFGSSAISWERTAGRDVGVDAYARNERESRDAGGGKILQAAREKSRDGSSSGGGYSIKVPARDGLQASLKVGLLEGALSHASSREGDAGTACRGKRVSACSASIRTSVKSYLRSYGTQPRSPRT